MRYLFISDYYPEYDRNSADFRLSQLIAFVAQYGKVDFWAIGEDRQIQETGKEDTARFRQRLLDGNVDVLSGSLRSVLQNSAYDAVFIEWYFSAAPLIPEIRLLQPKAKVITDSVDVVFNRLQAKARVSGLPEDAQKADEVRRLELHTYGASDLVLTVSDQDAEILSSLDSSINTFTIPNIHPIFEPEPQDPSKKILVFVGSRSEANDDAMAFFCVEVLPLILAEEPDTIFRCVGTVTKPNIEASLASAIEWLGFVPDTRPYLETSLISVAPLRFGGGMKGKVGEAMSLGLPVVSTTTGAEGFGIEPGRDLLVADDAPGFAAAVLQIVKDSALRERVRLAGWEFIRDNYSDTAVKKRVRTMVDLIQTLEPKPVEPGRRFLQGLTEWWHRHIAWRF